MHPGAGGNNGNCAAFQERHPDFEPLPVRNPLSSGPRRPQLWLLPQESSGNGMFVAAWNKLG